MHSARNVSCHANKPRRPRPYRRSPEPGSRNPKPIFNLNSHLPYNITVQEAIEAFETCYDLPDDKQDECYVAFGVDKRNVSLYLDVVVALEKSYQSAPYVSRKNKRSQSGSN